MTGGQDVETQSPVRASGQLTTVADAIGTAPGQLPSAPTGSAGSAVRQRPVPAIRSRRRAWRGPATVGLLYLLVAVGLLRNLWSDLPAGLVGPGQYLAEWYLWHAPSAVLGGTDPLVTTGWDPPAGANLMANPSLLGLALPLAPLTILSGPAVAFAVALTLGLAGSAAAWYWLFRRLVPGGRLGPVVGGAFVGFAPAMVAHAAAAQLHLAITAVIPLLIGQVLDIHRGHGGWRPRVALGLLVTYQWFLGEELLLLTVMGFGLFGGVWALRHRRPARSARSAGLAGTLRGLGLAALVALPLLAYPLWWQYAGPGHYVGLPAAQQSVNQVSGLVTLPPQSFLGDLNAAPSLVDFGLPLVMVLLVGGAHLRREPIVFPAALAAGLACALSFLPVVRSTLARVPVLNLLTASRLALVAVPFIGLLLTLMVARAMRLGSTGDALARLDARRVRGFALLAVAAALVSVAPAPLAVADRQAVPDLLSSGLWRQFMNPGSVALTTAGAPTPGWQVATDGGLTFVGGPFLVPDPADHSGRTEPPPTATQALVAAAWATGTVPEVTPAAREQARADLARLQVDVILLTEERHTGAVITLLRALLGRPPVQVDDLWMWRIRDGVAVSVF